MPKFRSLFQRKPEVSKRLFGGVGGMPTFLRQWGRVLVALMR
jgi:hypothetical protein